MASRRHVVSVESNQALIKSLVPYDISSEDESDSIPKISEDSANLIQKDMPPFDGLLPSTSFNSDTMDTVGLSKLSSEESLNDGSNASDPDYVPDNDICKDTYIQPGTSGQLLPTDSQSATNIFLPSTVTVAKANNIHGLRIWDKKYICPFCRNRFSKLPEHLLCRHANEKEVWRFSSMKKNSKERKHAIEKLRNAGLFLHNANVIKTNQGEIIPGKRPSSRSNVNPHIYVPCSRCYKYVVKKDLWRHSKNCVAMTENKTKEYGRAQTSTMLIPATAECSQRMSNTVLQKMNADTISLAAKNDNLILAFGSKVHRKHGHEKHLKTTYVSQKMRELARFLICIRHLDKTITKLSDCIQPHRFKSVVSAVRELCGFREDTNQFDNPHLVLKVGHSLNHCASIVLSEALMESNKDQEDKARAFEELYKKVWASELSQHALMTISRRKWNKLSILPLADDIRKFNLYLKKNLEEEKEQLRISPGKKEWEMLCKTTLALLILFNRRRVGETERLLLSTYINRDKSVCQSEVFEALSPVEKKLVETQILVETRGKRGNKVAIIFTQDLREAADLLVKYRKNAEINEINEYLFASCNFDSTNCLRGSDVIRAFSYECGAKEPEKLRSSKLRIHLGTMTRVLNLKDNELQNLSSFMGHSISVHNEFYKLPENTIYLAKVSKLLIAMDKCEITKYKGKTLDEMDPDLTGTDIDSNSECDNAMESSSDEDENKISKINKRISAAKITNKLQNSKAEIMETKLTNNNKKHIREDAKNMSDSGSSNDKSFEPPNTKKKCTIRQKWTIPQKYAVDKFFENFIAIERVPNKADCIKCIEESRGTLNNMKWSNVKFRVYNIIKSKRS